MTSTLKLFAREITARETADRKRYAEDKARRDRATRAKLAARPSPFRTR